MDILCVIIAMVSVMPQMHLWHYSLLKQYVAEYVPNSIV